MSLSLAQNAIALLIDLAERGEIDPWDVQVIEVIDRFLSKLQPSGAEDAVPETIAASESGRAPYEADLSQSGQAFLYASMLLLLKADSLVREASAEPPPEDLVDDLDSFVNTGLPPNLERRIRRRATAPPIPSRRVTLPELISQLNLIAAAIAEPKARRVVARRARPHTQKQAIRTIAQLAHQENLSEVAAMLEQFLMERWQELSHGEEWLEFEQLLHWWREAQTQKPPSSEDKSQTAAHTEAHSETSDRVGVFWALLLLSAQSKVELSQQVFYRDLNVRSLTVPTPDDADLPAFVLPD